MTGIFRANNPLNASILFIYGLLLKLPYLMHHQSLMRSASEGFLFRDIAEASSPVLDKWHLFSPLLAYTLLFTQAITLNYYLNSSKMMVKPNYLCAMSFLLVTSFFPEWNVLSVTLIVNTIMVWIIGRLLVLNSEHRIKGTIFNIGFIIGFCSFLYFPSIFILLVALFSLMIMRPMKVNEWIMIFLGFATIWYFLLAWLYLTNGLQGFDFSGLLIVKPEIEFTTMASIWLAIILVLTFTGIYYVRTEMAKQVIQVRKRWSIVLAGSLVLLATPFFNGNKNLMDWLLAVYFISPLIALAFYYIRLKGIRVFIHWAMVGLIIYFQYFR